MEWRVRCDEVIEGLGTVVWCAEGSGLRETSCLTNFLYYLVDDYTIKDIEKP